MAHEVHSAPSQGGSKELGEIVKITAEVLTGNAPAEEIEKTGGGSGMALGVFDAVTTALLGDAKGKEDVLKGGGGSHGASHSAPHGH